MLHIYLAVRFKSKVTTACINVALIAISILQNRSIFMDHRFTTPYNSVFPDQFLFSLIDSIIDIYNIQKNSP